MRSLRRIEAIEWVVVAAALGLVGQLLWGLGILNAISLSALDVRQWPRPTFIVVNAIIVAVLCAIRFLPEVAEGWRLKRAATLKARKEKEEHQHACEKRRRIQEIRDGRRRRSW